MTRTLESAIEALHRLPDELQDQLGSKILDYVEKHERLKAEIDKGMDDIKAGRFRELTPEVWEEIKSRARMTQ